MINWQTQIQEVLDPAWLHRRVQISLLYNEICTSLNKPTRRAIQVEHRADIGDCKIIITESSIHALRFGKIDLLPVKIKNKIYSENYIVGIDQFIHFLDLFIHCFVKCVGCGHKSLS